MPWADLTLKLVTPTYLGKFPDATTTITEVPFPVPSLRGTLAYWLRALAGAHVGDDPARLLKVESTVFGAARNRGTGGPSRILIRGGRIQVSSPPQETGDLGYLLGPGLIDDPSARYAKATVVDLRVRTTGPPAHADLFLAALWALRTFGGIGARTRRGFGSLAIMKGPHLNPAGRFQMPWLERDDPADLAKVLGCVSSALGDLGIQRGHLEPGKAPRSPNFAEDAYRMGPTVEIPGARDARAALAAVGKRLRLFRHTRDPDPHFAANSPHQLPSTAGYRTIAKPFATTGWPRTERFVDGALGLPVVYTVHGQDSSVTVEPLVDGKTARRASPLWLRVCNTGGGWQLRSLAFFAEWLPTGVPLQAKQDGRPSAPVHRPEQHEVETELNRWFTHLQGPTPR